MTLPLLPPSAPFRACSYLYVCVFPDGTEVRRRWRQHVTHAVCVRGSETRCWFVRQWIDDVKIPRLVALRDWRAFYRGRVRVELAPVTRVSSSRLRLAPV